MTKSLKTVPKWTKIGILGVVLLYSSVAGITSAALPWWIGKGDSALHVDYIYRLYNGDIPKYHEFVRYKPFHQIEKGYITQINRAGNNPPLFYILHAPVVGPLLQTGRWKPAIAVGRALNVFLGMLAVLAFAWAGWLYGGKRKALFAVAVPALGSLSYHFTNLNQNYALDVLLVLLGVLTAVAWHKLLEHGLRKRYLIWLLVLSILGMSTKATYAVFLGISLLAVVAAAYLHGRGTRLKRLITGSVISGVILAAVLIAIGWFYYYWNYKTSGKWYTAELPGDFKSRTIKSFHTVINSSGLWGSFYERFTAYEFWSKLLTYVSVFGVIVALARTRLRLLWKDKAALISVGLLFILLAGTAATQVSHAVGIGNYSFRYFLPALLVFSLFYSYGLLEFRKTRGVLLSFMLAAMTYSSIVTTAKLDNIQMWVPAVGSTDNAIEKLRIAITSNNQPAIVLVLLLLGTLVGFAATALALYKLTKPAQGPAKRRV